MRADIRHGASPDEQELAFNIDKIYLDGLEQRNAVAVDTETGELTRYRKNPDGTWVCNASGVVTEVVRGALVVMMKDGTNYVTTRASARQPRATREHSRSVDWFKLNRSFS